MTDLQAFTEMVDNAALLSLEHQIHLSEVVGEHSWQVDLSRPEFSFTGDNPIVCTRMHLLGSAAPGPRSWLWAWANPSGFHPDASALAESLGDWGRANGMALLGEAEVPFADLPGEPDDPNTAAGWLIEAAKALTGLYTHYTGPVGGGTRAAFLIEHPSFELPEPEPARVMRVLQQGLAELTLSNHRLAVYSYAANRGLSPTFDDDDQTVLSLAGPGLTAQVTFDEYARVKDISASLGATGS